MSLKIGEFLIWKERGSGERQIRGGQADQADRHVKGSVRFERLESRLEGRDLETETHS